MYGIILQCRRSTEPGHAASAGVCCRLRRNSPQGLHECQSTDSKLPEMRRSQRRTAPYSWRIMYCAASRSAFLLKAQQSGTSSLPAVDFDRLPANDTKTQRIGCLSNLRQLVEGAASKGRECPIVVQDHVILPTAPSWWSLTCRQRLARIELPVLADWSTHVACHTCTISEPNYYPICVSCEKIQPQFTLVGRWLHSKRHPRSSDK